MATTSKGRVGIDPEVEAKVAGERDSNTLTRRWDEHFTRIAALGMAGAWSRAPGPQPVPPVDHETVNKMSSHGASFFPPLLTSS
jgi:hypothetical protein